MVPCIDAEGGLWNAQFGGGGVQRFRTNGDRDIRVDVGVPNVTCCCIGGRNLDRLFITTARLTMTEPNLVSYPQAGGLFTLQIEQIGVPEPVFRTR